MISHTYARTQIYITSRKDTVSTTVNQIPNSIKTVVKARPVANLNVPIQVPVPVQIPMQVQAQAVPVQAVHPVQAVPVVQPMQMSVAKPHTPQELNKLFNEMKNSRKPFMTISMKGPTKSTSIFPDPFSLFDDNK